MRKVASGFFFEFIRTNVQIIVHLTDQEQIIFNLISSNERISKDELAIRINKSEKTVQRIISKLIEYKLIERVVLFVIYKILGRIMVLLWF